MDMKNYVRLRICPSLLTCRMVKMVTKTITKMEQIATPTRATNATGDLIWSDELAPPSIEASIRAASPLNRFPSSASCDNCFSAAMRRFPAGEELMQSPVKVEQTKPVNEMNVTACEKSNFETFLHADPFIFINSYLFIVRSSCQVSPWCRRVHTVLFLKNDISVIVKKGGNILNRNKWQCFAENGNEIHVKFITRVLLSFEKWVTKIWWQSDEKR